ncbi:MAG TPA: hypothetical protein VJX28_07105, partial [Chthoniobacterales bacterium]|nr:hypothetical protein [Chthoniobacterales bacterium]
MTSTRTAATAAALTATLGLAAASWVVAVRQMRSAKQQEKPRDVQRRTRGSASLLWGLSSVDCGRSGYFIFLMRRSRDI